MRKPFTMHGKLDDRYNGDGFALNEMRRLEAMFQRGNLCRFQYGPLALDGIVTEWDFPVQRTWDIDYEFTVSVHQRPDEANLDRSPETPSDPSTLLDDLDLAVQGMLDADNLAPRSMVGGALSDTITAQLVETTTARERLATTLDNRDMQINDASPRSFAPHRAQR